MTDTLSLFGGLAASWSVDLAGDEIVRGAFRATLPEFLRRGLLLWAHDPARPIGMIHAAAETDRGLHILWQFHSTPDGQAAETFLEERNRAKLDTGLSIGFRTRKAAPGPGGIRRLLEIDLMEVSLVGLPLNTQANADRPKGGVQFGSTVPLAGATRATSGALTVELARARQLGII